MTINMKFIIQIIIAGLFFFFSQGRINAGSPPRYRFLVLGFDSTHINNIQSRLLREKLLWDLHNNGHSIVTVMEFEKVFNNTSEDIIKKYGEDNIKKFTMKFNADYSISGKIFQADKDKSKNEIINRMAYICEIFLYEKKSEKFKKLLINSEGKEDYFQYFSELSKKIIEEVNKNINNK